MNNNKPQVVQIMETLLPTIEDEPNKSFEETGIISKCNKPGAAIFQTFDENDFIHTQHGSLVMASVPQMKPQASNKYYPTYSDTVDTRKPYSSTTIVGAGEIAQVC